MKKASVLVIGILGLTGLCSLAEDKTIEGNLTVTSNLTSQTIFSQGAAVGVLLVEDETIINGKLNAPAEIIQMGPNAVASHTNTFIWSDGTPFGSSAAKQFSAFAENGFWFMGGPIYGNGSGLTNLNVLGSLPANSITSDKLASGSVTASKLGAGSVDAAALAAGAVQASNIALQSIGTNKMVAGEWSQWADNRYMSKSGMPDLVMNPGRMVAGYGLNLTNISSTAYGASQKGVLTGSNSVMTIMVDAYGASQAGNNSATQTIGQTAYGASQRGANTGNQTIGASAYGALQQGYNRGVQTVGTTAFGALQMGYNMGTQTLNNAAYGAMQRGYNTGSQSIGAGARGASQQGFNFGTQTIGGSSVGASQSGLNGGTQAIGVNSSGAEQRGYVAQYAGATNSGVGSVQLLNLAANQSALITGKASIGLGASIVTNDQAIVAGDGLVSHGNGTVTAQGFYGDGSGLTNLNLSGLLPTNTVTPDMLDGYVKIGTPFILTQTNIGAQTLTIATPFSKANPADLLDWYYTSDGNAVTITGYSGSAMDVVIPDWIDGLPVTAIGEWAFSDSSAWSGLPITSVSGGNNILTVGASAFCCCYSLSSVSLSTATTIGDYAFFSCNSLISVTLPAAITIGCLTFDLCNGLTSVTLPEAKSVLAGAFYYCQSLTSVSLPSATSIGDSAFEGCTSLTSLTLPATTYIGNWSFYGCWSLTSVTLPVVTMIGSYAFEDCLSLTSVTFSGDAPYAYQDIYLCNYEGYYYANPNVINYVINPNATGWGETFGDCPVVRMTPPLAEGDAVTKAYLRSVLSALPPQGDLSMGSFTDGAPTSFPLTF